MTGHVEPRITERPRGVVACACGVATRGGVGSLTFCGWWDHWRNRCFCPSVIREVDLTVAGVGVEVGTGRATVWPQEVVRLGGAAVTLGTPAPAGLMVIAEIR